MNERVIEIDGSIETPKDHDTWIDDFVMWLESRDESYFGFSRDITDDQEELPWYLHLDAVCEFPFVGDHWEELAYSMGILLDDKYQALNELKNAISVSVDPEGNIVNQEVLKYVRKFVKALSLSDESSDREVWEGILKIKNPSAFVRWVVKLIDDMKIEGNVENV